MTKNEFQTKLELYVALHRELGPYVSSLVHRGLHTCMWNVDSVIMTGVDRDGEITWESFGDRSSSSKSSWTIEHLVDWYDKSTCMDENGLKKDWRWIYEHGYGSSGGNR